MTTIERLQAQGIRRIGTPKRGFRYRTAQGRAVSEADRARIAALRIPPAWTDVAIATKPDTPIQAIGRDVKGRWQYRYHARQVERRERLKQERLVRFLAALPEMRRTIARDLAQPGLARDKMLAGILMILGTCFLRPGSEDYLQNGSFGIATLRRRHVRVHGDAVEFDFVGKAGKRQQHAVRDARLARLVRELLRHPGEVFKYRNDEGAIADVRRKHINAYIKQVMGESFSAKDFRTWGANLLFASALARAHASLDGAGPTVRRRAVTEALRDVAGRLGNTPAVCRASYVFDALIDHYQAGTVVRESLSNPEDLGRARSIRLQRAERALLALLQRRPPRPDSRRSLRRALSRSIARARTRRGRHANGRAGHAEPRLEHARRID